jgi:hypothetical protein
VDNVRLLANLWPQALREQSLDGSLPLHLALYNGNDETLQFLVSEWPQAREESSAVSDLERPRLLCGKELCILERTPIVHLRRVVQRDPSKAVALLEGLGELMRQEPDQLRRPVICGDVQRELA